MDIIKRKRSRIIIDMIQGNIDVAQALEILDLLLEDLNDENIKKWVKNEINGYSAEESVPKYRKANAEIIGTVKTYTAVISRYNIPIPLEDAKELCVIDIRDGLNKIVQMAIAEKEIDSHALSIPLNIAYINSIACINGEVTHAHRQLSMYTYNNILGSLKSKILSIFKELEKNYGNLDEYYIDFQNDIKEHETTKNITNIIFDNSIKIGDKNKIDDSIIGNNNNE